MSYIKHLSLRIIFLSFILSAIAFTATAQQRSVVLIHTESGSGYGVAYGAPNKIVTALHLVSGKTQIEVNWEGKKSFAKVEKIYKKADLALIQLLTPLNIPMLDIYNSDAPFGIDLNYWEAKPGTKLMSSKTTQLQRRTTLGKIDPRLAQNPAAQLEFAKSLCTDGQSNYPTLNTSIIKFGEKNIDKAHSGSPITFEGKIVGMVDGGEKPVNGSVSVWAIPALEFQNLFTLGVPPPGSQPTCSSDKLYSGLRSDNPFLSPELQQMAQQIEYSQANPISGNGEDGFSFSLQYRTNCQDLYETLFPEDQEYIQDIVRMGEEGFHIADPLSVYDLYPQEIDIYQDGQTGATIAIPTYSNINIEQENGRTLIEVSSQYEGITMYIYVSHNHSMEEAQSEKEWFKSYLVSDGLNWEEDENSQGADIIDYSQDYYDPYYFEDMQRVIYDGEGYITSEFYATMTISDTDFLGVSVQVNDWQTLDDDPNERLISYLMEACTMITDFGYY
ncbi:MAG: hypothetical protein SF052_25235 [Bacteroidia bacterium]|nr:hypothetical protein [Bacteroidia bacterium]